MNFLIAAVATVVLVPVAHDDPLLSDETTFVTDVAQQFLNDNGAGTLQCMDMPERSSIYTRICMTSDEWHETLTRAAAERESVDTRNRAILRGNFFGHSLTTEVTP